MAVKAQTQVTLFNVSDGTDGKMLYGICSSSGTTRTVTIDGVTSYYTGLTIAVKFTVATSNSMTLNVNSLGAKNVYFYNTSTGSYCPANYMVILVYEMSTNASGCWKAAYSYNSDTYDRTRYNATVKASSAITSGNIIVGNASGFFHLKTGAAFDIAYPILYAGSSISSGSTGTNNYTEISHSITATQSITLTVYKTVYIKGTLSGNTFTPVSTTPLTQTEPTSEDGYYYILLGVAYAAAYIRLLSEHKIYKYFGGSFQVWNGAQDTAEDAKKVATNYMNYDSMNGLIIGNKTSGSWSGNRAQVTSGAFNILDSSGTQLATFGASSRIGKESSRHLDLGADAISMSDGADEFFSFQINEKYKELVAAGHFFEGCTTYMDYDIEGTYQFQIKEALAEGEEYIWHVCSDNGTWQGSGTAPTLDYGYRLFKAGTTVTASTATVFYTAVPTSVTIGENTSYCSKIGTDSITEFKLKGRVVVENDNDVSGLASSYGASLLLGDPQGKHLAMDGTEIMAKSDDETPSTLDLNAEGGVVYFGRNAASAFYLGNIVLASKNKEWDDTNWYQLVGGPNSSGNIVFGYGGYYNQSGQTRLYGNSLRFIPRVGGAAAEYKPYFEAGDSFSISWNGAGFISNSGKTVIFTIPLSKPVLGSPAVTVVDGGGYILRQNGKYTNGSASGTEAATTSTTATLTADNHMINIRATFSSSTNATNNAAIGIAASLTIEFS